MPGQTFFQDIENELKQASITIVLWSTLSIESKYVRAEASLADSLDTNQLISTSIDGTLPPYPFNNEHAALLSPWLNDNLPEPYHELIAAINKIEPVFEIQDKERVEEVLKDEEETWKLVWVTIVNSKLESAQEYRSFIDTYQSIANPAILLIAENRVALLDKTEPIESALSLIHI